MVKEVNCYICGNNWQYKGRNPLRASCSVCGYKISFKKSDRLLKEKGIIYFNELSNKFYSGGINNE